MSVPRAGDTKIGEDGRLLVYVPIEDAPRYFPPEHIADVSVVTLLDVRRTWRAAVEKQAGPDSPVAFYRNERYGHRRRRRKDAAA